MVVGVLLTSIQGCFQEKIEKIANRETLSFEGVYSNQYNSNTLVFKEGVMTYQAGDQTMTREFEVDGSELFVKFRNSSKEKRDDLVMRIHGEGEVLTCSACARYSLMNFWVKENFEHSQP
ncbi:hypothetical protein QF117_01030 [Vibrio sp. YMD68]|uniref:hypothetical protein n=1 Tax=Vibrio sp. YMD68 TaxID=3042300 RepID=UPI00249A879D|nr:hypothetical protein [Vibrio sp. YMD68]WGV98951.1 hypothetical protein QF117_01030 [Vibrio sp. YMD68]